MHARHYRPPTRLYPTSLKSLGLDRARADVYSNRCPSPADFVVLVDGITREIDPQSGKVAGGPRITPKTELRLMLKRSSTLATNVDQSRGVAKGPDFVFNEPGFLKVGAAFPVHVNEHGVAYLTREHPGRNTITVATRSNGNGVNTLMWEVSLVNQARINPRGGRSVADNWFVQIRDIVAEDAASQDRIYYPTAAELQELETNVAILTWWMPAGLYGQVVAHSPHPKVLQDGPFVTLAVHYNGWRRAVHSGEVPLPLRPTPGARIRYTSIRADEDGFAEAVGLSFI